MSEEADGTAPQFDVDGICHVCARRRGARTCEAFPLGIPPIILVGNFVHTKPYPGDGGLTFAKRV